MGRLTSINRSTAAGFRRVAWCVHMLILLLALQAGTALADAGKDFYMTLHTVADQSVAERNKAIKAGFDRLLVRLSGQMDAPSNPRVLSAKRHVSAYVQEFRYFQKLVPASGQGADVDAGTAVGAAGSRNNGVVSATQLELRFSESAILQLLRSAGLAFWPPDRPRLLLWLVADDYQAGLHWLTLQEEPELARTLEIQSRQFGVSMALPLLDLEDLVVISLEKAWALDEDALSTASARYNVQGILVGRFAKTSQGEWRSSWTFKHNGVERVHDEQTETVLSGLENAVQDTMATLASRYAIVPSADGPQGIVVRVQGVSAFADYERALRYFEQLPMVRSLTVSAVVGPELTLTLFAEGGLDLLQERLLRDGKVEYLNAIDGALPQWQREAVGTLSNPILLGWPGA